MKTKKYNKKIKNKELRIKTRKTQKKNEESLKMDEQLVKILRNCLKAYIFVQNGFKVSNLLSWFSSNWDKNLKTIIG